MGSDSVKDPQGLLRRLKTEHRLLSREHAEVKARVRDYTTRRYLTAGEQLECRTLQRLKMHKKDALAALEQRLYALERGLSPEATL
jgi:hypothetical protein